MSNDIHRVWDEFVQSNEACLAKIPSFNIIEQVIEKCLKELDYSGINSILEQVAASLQQCGYEDYNKGLVDIISKLKLVLCEISHGMNKKVEVCGLEESTSKFSDDLTMLEESTSKFFGDLTIALQAPQEKKKKSIVKKIMLGVSASIVLSSVITIIGFGLKMNVFIPILPSLHMGLSIANYAFLSVALILIVSAAIIKILQTNKNASGGRCKEFEKEPPGSSFSRMFPKDGNSPPVRGKKVTFSDTELPMGRGYSPRNFNKAQAGGELHLPIKK